MKLELAIVLLPLLAGAARAEDSQVGSAPVRALLADPVQLATWLADRDPKVESARAKVTAARAAGDQARVVPNPELSVAVGGLTLGTTNPPGLGLKDTTNYQVGLSELVELGKRGPRKHAADLRSNAAGEQAIASLGDRLGDATTALGKLTYAAAKREVIATNLTAARRLRDSEELRRQKGDLSPLEFDRIELDADELELELGRAEAELAGAQAECTYTLGVQCMPAGLDAAALDAGAPLPAALPETKAAIEARPDRVASRLESQALGEDANLASHRAIPDPTIGVSYLFDNLTIAGNQEQQFILSVGIPLPLFDRGSHDAAAARANAHAIAAEDEYEVREAHGLVDSLLAQRNTLQTTLQKLEQVQLPRSTAVVELTQKAFDLGEVRLVDLLLVERSHRDLLAEVIDTRFELFSVRAQLRQALGLDDEVARAVNGRQYHE
jgi:cobalt-zinc-cadmium efflux system outer membrane protein